MLSLIKVVTPIVLGTIIVFSSALLLGLRRALTKTPGPVVRVEIRESPPAIEVSITVHPTHPPIRVESIVLPRNVGEALGLGTPDRFSLTKTTLPDPRSFEPDLTELAEQGSPTSAEQIKRVTEAQYHEALGTATDMEGRYMTYEGELVIRRGTTASVMFPAAQAMPTAGTITVTYSNRSKLWRVAGGVSATFE